VGACLSPMLQWCMPLQRTLPPCQTRRLTCRSTRTASAEGCAAPTVAVLFEDTKEQRHVKTYEVSLREKVLGLCVGRVICGEGVRG
jgi:hypothetical protein